ncbi:hypothetical protein LAJ59_20955, partial [Streptococcus pneumoniae]|nr:hypothetical protein [Streptococcus pneumoniae]
MILCVLLFLKQLHQHFDSALAIPNVSQGGTPTLRKTVPFSSPFSQAGNKGVESYKYLKLQDKT